MGDSGNDEMTLRDKDLRISRDMLHRICIVTLRQENPTQNILFSDPVKVDDAEAVLSKLLDKLVECPTLWDDKDWPKLITVRPT
jgi:hypothetical protein